MRFSESVSARLEDGVLVVTIDNPPVNGLGYDTRRELAAVGQAGRPQRNKKRRALFVLAEQDMGVEPGVVRQRHAGELRAIPYRIEATQQDLPRGRVGEQFGERVGIGPQIVAAVEGEGGEAGA